MRDMYDTAIPSTARACDACAHGIKHGSTMVILSPSQRVDGIAAAMDRLSTRYGIVMRMPRVESIIVDGQVMTRFMPAADRRRLREWFETRYAYLEEQLCLAINSADNIIGKQWAFDSRPRLGSPEENSARRRANGV